MDHLLGALSAGGLTCGVAGRRSLADEFLASALREGSPEARRAEAVRWVGTLLRDSGQWAPPTSLEPICDRLRARIEVCELIAHGRLVYSGEGESTILVRKTLTSGARRFTIAHELGHLMLRRAAEKRVADRVRREQMFGLGSSNEQERLCDLIAVELLLPRDWLDNVLAAPNALTCGATSAIALVDMLSQRFNVSVVAAALRVVESTRRYCIVYWREAERPGSTKKLRVAWSILPSGVKRPFIPRFKPAAKSGLVHESHTSQRAVAGLDDLSGINFHEGPSFIECVPHLDGVLSFVHIK